MRIELFLQSLIDDVNYAERTLAIQKVIGRRKS